MVFFATAMGSWCILTGEYPPKIGGVSAYTRSIAAALAHAGDAVEVWAPLPAGELARDPGVEAHVLPDHFGPRSLLLLERELAKRPDARILVQYVPHAFGMGAMNVPFALWLAARRRPVWVMIHEVAEAIARGAPWRHNVIGAVTQGMAALLARRADRLFVTTSAWNPHLKRLAPRSIEPTCIPIPSNLPEEVTAEEIARARAQLGFTPDDILLGSFGTYGAGVTPLLLATLTPVLARDTRRVALLMGRGSAELATRAFGPPGKREARVVATGELEPAAAAAHLAGCAAVLQPYADGVTTRRTSAMAGLALGVPVITNTGDLCEPFWRDSGAVVLAPAPSAEALARATDETLADAPLRAALGLRGKAFYQKNISLAHAIRMLRGEP